MPTGPRAWKLVGLMPICPVQAILESRRQSAVLVFTITLAGIHLAQELLGVHGGRA